MKKNSQSGFTLIELLVVIAIIGILASVVLASLNTARAKGADAAIKSGMANARAQAELYYDNNTSSYATVCTAATGVTSILLGAVKNSPDADGAMSNNAATTATAATCNDSAGAWAAEIPLKTSGAGFYCVDSTGKSQVNSALGLSTTTDYAC